MEEVDLCMAFPRLLFLASAHFICGSEVFCAQLGTTSPQVGGRTDPQLGRSLGKLWLFGQVDIQTTIHMYTQHQYSIYNYIYIYLCSPNMSTMFAFSRVFTRCIKHSISFSENPVVTRKSRGKIHGKSTGNFHPEGCHDEIFTGGITNNNG